MNKSEVAQMLVEQKMLCEKYKTEFHPINLDGKIGIAIDVAGKMPITGVRKPLSNGLEGWYIWSGEYSNDDNFFKPIHAIHLHELLPIVEKYLALKPGFKFIVDDEGYEDVWFDETLLKD
jgi:hypothetical protein